MAKMDAKSIGVWVLCVIVGLFFLAGGIPKLMQTNQMMKSFEAWGYSSGFVLLIGLLEALGGLDRHRRSRRGLCIETDHHREGNLEGVL